MLIRYVKENENFTNAWHKSARDRSSLKGELGFKFLDDGTLDVGFEKHNPSGQKVYDVNVGKNFGDNWRANIGAKRKTPRHGKHENTVRAELKRRFLDGEAFIGGSTTGGNSQVDAGFKWKFDEGGFVEAPVEQQLASIEHDPKLKIDIFSNLETEIGTWALKPLLDMGVNEDELRKVFEGETTSSKPLSYRLQEQNKKGSSARGLFQFIETTANWLGTTTDDIAKMSLPEQVLLYKKYLKKHKWKPGIPLAMMQAAPSYAKKPDNFVVYTKEKNPEKYKNNLAWVPLDKNGKRIKDAPITVKSIKDYYKRQN